MQIIYYLCCYIVQYAISSFPHHIIHNCWIVTHFLMTDFFHSRPLRLFWEDSLKNMRLLAGYTSEVIYKRYMGTCSAHCEAACVTVSWTQWKCMCTRHGVWFRRSEMSEVRTHNIGSTRDNWTQLQCEPNTTSLVEVHPNVGSVWGAGSVFTKENLWAGS